MRQKIFYSVQNGGDGSAYPEFMESMELADFDQEHMSEGWGESCTGSITIESDSPIKCPDMTTKESYFIEHYCDDSCDTDERDEFISKFFPDGLPTFTVKTGKPDGKYVYNNVYVDGKLVAKVFRTIAKSGDVYEELLNSISE